MIGLDWLGDALVSCTIGEIGSAIWVVCSAFFKCVDPAGSGLYVGSVYGDL